MLNEYLAKLREELELNGVADRDEIIDYFAEIISDRLDNGEDIETILETIGGPKDVAKAFKSDEGEKKKVDKTDKEIVRMDLDVIHDIDIDVVSYHFEINRSDDERGHLVYEKDEDCSLDVSFDDGDLEISQDMVSTTLGSIIMGWAGRSRKKINRSYKAWLYLPEGGGDLQMNGVSGTFRLEGIDLGDAQIESVSGNIGIKSCRFEELECNSVSGNISFTDMMVDNELQIELVSGDVEAEMIECPDIDIETVSGSVDLAIIGSRKDTAIEIEKLGSRRCFEADGDRSLSVETISGRVTYRFTE